MPLAPGTHLTHYEILSPLGAGRMGEVYRARDSLLEREVAIKVLPEHLARNAEALARFEREAKAVAALSHPNILAIHEFGADQGISFAVTELLEGETLRSRLTRAAFPWRKAVEMDPDYFLASMYLGIAYVQMQMYEENRPRRAARAPRQPGGPASTGRRPGPGRRAAAGPRRRRAPAPG